MKVLVDTSVWLPALRKKPISTDLGVDALFKLITTGQSVYILGLIMYEVVCGFRTPKERKELEQMLSAFPIIEISKEDYLYAVDVNGACRMKGITTSTVDSIIAAAAIRYDCHLLTTDKDFERIAKITPLQLLKY